MGENCATHRDLFPARVTWGHALVEARLLLCYEREDGTTRTLLSGRHVDAWLKHIDRVLSAADFPSLAPPPEPAAWLDAPSPQGESDDAGLDGSYQSVAPAFSADSLRTPVVFGRIRTLSAAFGDALIQAEHAAHSNLGVLILGETGTGKEHLARAIHEASARARGPFVAVNCSSVPDGLIESDLFGHQKGAFSGTQGTRDGLIVAAHGGTLFLDEIGDAPLRIQNALLRVLDDHRVRPVGADKERPVDVRVIAATSRDVDRLRREGTLRDDLYFRLAEQPITIPPLRERLCDMRTLAVSILEGEDSSKGLSPQALSKLQRYHWPGNIRELRNALRRAVVIGRDLDVLEPHCFPDLQTKEVALGEDAAPFDFPDLVRGVAMLAWKEHDLNVAAVKSTHGMRALQRAALLYLRTVHGLRAFPPPLVSDWTRLFGAKWFTSENGRGLKEVLRALGVPVTDRRAAEWVVRVTKG